MKYLNLEPMKLREVKPLTLEERDEIIELLDTIIRDSVNHELVEDDDIEKVQNFVNNYRRLEAHKACTVGLWATDKVEEAKGDSFFQITF